MPTISCNIKDLCLLLPSSLSLEELKYALEKAKAEIKEYLEETGEIKIEIADTNRPDLWSPEGLARQIRGAYFKEPLVEYKFFNEKPVGEIKVHPNLKDIRPYIGAFLVENLVISEDILLSLIQTQEKLADNFGRKRETIAIGIYNAKKITFPLSYTGVEPLKTRFIPLEFTEALTLEEILKIHPKGKEYGHLVKDSPVYPVIIDSRENILSFPPIINSASAGKVKVGDDYLFVEVTGKDLRAVHLTINILACNLADRGGEIKPLAIIYPEKVVTPQPITDTIKLNINYLNKILGENLSSEEIKFHLNQMGHKIVEEKDGVFICQSPPYRMDCMHEVDLIEDFAIARGYDTFTPKPLTKFTLGRISPFVEESLVIRDIMIGMGFEEFITYILNSRENLFTKMNIPGGEAIEIENIMSERYAILRPLILPSLLEIESKNAKVEYPHKIFELGEVVEVDSKENYGCKTTLHLGALLAYPKATFSELQSYLQALFYYYAGEKLILEPANFSFLIPGRTGEIILSKQKVGFIGEVHPAVLTNWGIIVPTVAFEIDIRKVKKSYEDGRIKKAV